MRRYSSHVALQIRSLSNSESQVSARSKNEYPLSGCLIKVLVTYMCRDRRMKSFERAYEIMGVDMTIDTDPK